MVLIAVAMIGFNQNWHVEEERPVGGEPMHGEGDDARRRRGSRLSAEPVR